MDKNLQKEYIVHKAWGMSASIDIKGCDLDKIRNPAVLQDYVIQLCKLIDMKRYGDVQLCNFGTGDKAGYTLMQLIETSCITAHFSNEKAAAYIDIFSCKFFDPETAAEFSHKFFEGDSSTVSCKLRK